MRDRYSEGGRGTRLFRASPPLSLLRLGFVVSSSPLLALASTCVHLYTSYCWRFIMNTVSAVCSQVEFHSYFVNRTVLGIYGQYVSVVDSETICRRGEEMVAVNTESVAMDKVNGELYYKHLCHFRTKDQHASYTLDDDDFDLDDDLLDLGMMF